MPESDPTFGLAGRDAWRGYQVKGSLLAARPRYVRDTWGDAAFADVAARLHGETRAAFESAALPFAWYPFRPMAEIDRAIVAGPMGGDLAQMKRFGSTIARYDLSTIYKMLFKVGSPAFILKRIGVVYSTYIRGGSITPVSVEKGHAVVVLGGGDFPFYFCDQGIPGWFAAAVELSGGKNVHVVQAECVHRGAARCSWEARWA
jgi:predicted hydrocarbon binding protein